jgi:hypothetical protein
MFADAAECVYIGVIGVMIEVVVLFVEHLLRGGKFDREGAHPPYISAGLATKSASLRPLGIIRRRSKVWSRMIELARSGVSDSRRDDAKPLCSMSAPTGCLAHHDRRYGLLHQNPG